MVLRDAHPLNLGSKTLFLFSLDRIAVWNDRDGNAANGSGLFRQTTMLH
jgi:hypothetical protein